MVQQSYISKRFLRRRGSALIYTSVMMVAITSIVVGTVGVNAAAAQKAEKRYAEAKLDETFNAQVALVTSLCKNDTIPTLPYDFHTDLNGRRMYCRVSDNGANIPRTYLLTSDLTGSRSSAWSTDFM